MRRREFLNSLGAGSLAALAPAGTEDSRESPPRRKTTSGRRDARVEVDLGRIAWNLSQLKNHAQVPVMAVVKANAYGHGIVAVSKALEKAGASWLMVGKLEEAVTLREAGLRCPTLNFGPWDGQDCEEIVRRGISQSVYTEDVALLDEEASRLGTRVTVHVDIDTGMGRTGIPAGRALRLIEKIASLPHLKIEGVSTTLTEDTEFDQEQLRRFMEVCQTAKARGIALGLRHAASSAGILASPEFRLDMVRPGITLYGYYPNQRTRKQDLLGLKPALKLAATVIFIKDLTPGESLSYLRVFTAQKKTRVATAGIGYSDGYPPQLGGKGWVMIRNKKFPVLNAVTSNHLMIELGEDREIQVGDEVTLIAVDRNFGLTADRLAEQGGVSDYKILIGLNPLLPREYV